MWTHVFLGWLTVVTGPQECGQAHLLHGPRAGCCSEFCPAAESPDPREDAGTESTLPKFSHLQKTVFLSLTTRIGPPPRKAQVSRPAYGA